jgi:uncharacterized protein YndB with AHSA1/START domain
MGRLPASGSNSVVVDAHPDDVWSVVSDPTAVGQWSHETRTCSWVAPATHAEPGALFTGGNVMGRIRWARRNEVLAVDPPRSISWRTIPSRLYPDSTRWTLTVEPAGEGTRLTQDFEILKLHPLVDRLFYLAIPAHRDRSEALRSDLVRIGELAAARGRATA